MNQTEALIIVKRVCAEFRGTLAEHQQIQAAMQLLEKALEPKAGPPATLEPAS